MSEADRPVWAPRLGYLIQESFNFIGKWSRHQRESVVVRAVPSIDRKANAVHYRYGLRGDPVPFECAEELRDILGRARSILDIAMYASATAQASPGLSDKQKRSIYFPIVAEEGKWAGFAASPHGAALTKNQRDALRSIQPFATNNRVVHWLNELHRTDKHQKPLEIAAIPDPLFPMLFTELNPPGQTYEHWIDWVHPLPAVANRVQFVEFRSVKPIKAAGIEDVTITLAVWVEDGWRDIQEFLRDVLEFTARACSLLSDGNTALADAFKEHFDAERRQLSAFNRMIVERDEGAEEEWLSTVEQRYGRRPGGEAFHRRLTPEGRKHAVNPK